MRPQGGPDGFSISANLRDKDVLKSMSTSIVFIF